MKSFFLASLLTVFLNYSKGKVTLINVLNLTDSPDETHDRNIVDNHTIVVGVLLPRNVEGSNDVVAKVRRPETVLSILTRVVQYSELDSVLPAVVLAAEELSNWSWVILVGDTECSSTQGPLHAVEMFYKRKPDVFLGPVCPYVLAPVVR